MATLPDIPTEEDRETYYRVKKYFDSEDIKCVLSQMDHEIHDIDQQIFDSIVDDYGSRVFWEWQEVAMSCIKDLLSREKGGHNV